MSPVSSSQRRDSDIYRATATDSYLQYPLVVDLVKDGPVDLVGFQGYPVEDGHTELSLDWFLDLNSWTGTQRS